MLHKADAAPPPPRLCAKPKPRPSPSSSAKTIGLDTGSASADYIHLYHGNAALLTESLEVIQQTSAVILSALETPAAEADRTNQNPNWRKPANHGS